MRKFNSRLSIAFAYDFFRSPLLNTWNGEINAHWLYGLFARQIEPFGASVRCFTEKGPTPDIPVLDALAASGLPPTAESWALFSSGMVDLGDVYRSFRDCDLVMGYELAPSLMRYLSIKGIRYLDFSIDPARFAPDLFFTVRTNDPHAEAELAKREIADSQLLGAVGLIRSPVIRTLADRGDDPIGDAECVGATLFVAQSDIDASLFVRGKLQRVANHVEALLQAKPAEEILLIKPHPFGVDHADVRFLHERFPESVITNDNVYALLSLPQVHRVVTLSSSVAKEAELFGKPATRLILPDKDSESLGRQVVSRPYRVELAQFDSTFWGNVVLEQSAVTTRPAISWPAALRSALGMNWSYFGGSVAPPSRLLKPAERYEFSTTGRGSVLLAFGWHEVEDWGVWSQGGVSTLLFTVDPSPQQPWMIGLEMRPFIGHVGDSIVVKLSARGAMQAEPKEVLLSDNTVKTLELTLFPSKSEFDNQVEITIDVQGARSPKEVGASGDYRVLGIGLMSLGQVPFSVEIPKRDLSDGTGVESEKSEVCVP